MLDDVSYVVEVELEFKYGYDSLLPVVKHLYIYIQKKVVLVTLFINQERLNRFG